MSDPNAPRPEERDPASQPRDPEQPVDGFAVMDEQHAAPSAPAAPGTPDVGEPARSFSSPAADPAPAIPGQPPLGQPVGDEHAGDGGHGWQQGQQPEAAGYAGPGAAPLHGALPGEQSYGQPGHSQYGEPQHGQQGAAQPQPEQTQYGQGQYGQSQYAQPGPASYGQPQYGAPGQPQYGAPGQPQYSAAAPMSPVDEKNAGMWGHLSGLSTIVTGGFGGWIGPLIVFLIYKDRSAFARQESKEALNFGIFMTILAVGIWLLALVLGIVTFGIGSLIGLFYWIPGLLQVIFSIIGAIRVNNGGSYRYPFNWRLVK